MTAQLSAETVEVLKDAKAKLAVYRKQTRGEYDGGPEYSALIRRIDRVIAQLTAAGPDLGGRPALAQLLDAINAMRDAWLTGHGVDTDPDYLRKSVFAVFHAQSALAGGKPGQKEDVP
jgi:hypothetical protein